MSRRTVLRCLLFGGSVVTTITFCSLNIAMVAMVKQRPFNDLETNASECHSVDAIAEMNRDIVNLSESLNIGGMHRSVFEWDGAEQGLVLGSIYWLCWVTQLLGGYLARQYGAKLVYGLANLFASLLFFITPMALYYSIEWLLVVRAVQSLLLGLTFACVKVIAEEPQCKNKARHGTWLYGEVAAIAVGYPVFGWVMHVARWDDVMYLSGWIGVAWGTCWLLFLYSCAVLPPRVGRIEEGYREQFVAGSINTADRPSTPWRRLFTSSQVWLNIMVDVCFIVLSSFCVIYLPLFFGMIHRTEILCSTTLIGFSFFLRLITSWTSFKISSRTKKAHRTSIRRLFTYTAMVVPGLCLVAVAQNICDTHLVTIILVAAIAATGFSADGFKTAVDDISPNFGGTIRGVVGIIGTLAALALTTFVGFMTHGNQSPPQWRIILQVVGGISATAGVIYTIFGKSDALQWNDREKPKGVELLMKSQFKGSNNNNNSLPSKNQKGHVATQNSQVAEVDQPLR